MTKKSAFVAVIGRPSVGKSTLVNKLCGEKVAIVSPVPQTTRNAIRGIVNRPEGQLVFVDTPGRHFSEKKFNKKLMETGSRILAEADLVLYVFDASRAPGVEEHSVAELVKPYCDRTVAAINKSDLAGVDIGGARDFLVREAGLCEEHSLVVSALTGDGVEELLTELFKLAPDGDAHYPEDYYTDQSVPFRIAEIIREKAIIRLKEELPHSIYVEIADTEFKEDGKRLWVRAFIMVERESQKGIVVGKGGEMIKNIRQAAQKDMNRIFEWKTELDLRVKTSHDWRHKDSILKSLLE